MNLNELKQLEDQLWSAADSLRANTDLKPNEYSTPVLGLIFLKFADNKYGADEEAILKEFCGVSKSMLTLNKPIIDIKEN